MTASEQISWQTRHEIISWGTSFSHGGSISDIALPMLMHCMMMSQPFSAPISTTLGEGAHYLLYLYNENKDQRLRESK